jgi:hypothetical protein
MTNDEAEISFGNSRRAFRHSSFVINLSFDISAAAPKPGEGACFAICHRLAGELPDRVATR